MRGPVTIPPTKSRRPPPLHSLDSLSLFPRISRIKTPSRSFRNSHLPLAALPQSRRHAQPDFPSSAHPLLGNFRRVNYQGLYLRPYPLRLPSPFSSSFPVNLPRICSSDFVFAKLIHAPLPSPISLSLAPFPSSSNSPNSVTATTPSLLPAWLSHWRLILATRRSTPPHQRPASIHLPLRLYPSPLSGSTPSAGLQVRDPEINYRDSPISDFKIRHKFPDSRRHTHHSPPPPPPPSFPSH